MKPANVTAGKGLSMWLLGVSEGGDEHEASQRHGRQRVNDVDATVLFLNRFGVTSPDFGQDVRAQHSRHCCDMRCFLDTGL